MAKRRSKSKKKTGFAVSTYSLKDGSIKIHSEHKTYEEARKAILKGKGNTIYRLEDVK